MEKPKVPTELSKLKKLLLKKDGQPRADADPLKLVRLKTLMDQEPLSAAEIAEAEKREAEQKQKEVDEYRKRMASQAAAGSDRQEVEPPDPALDKPGPPAEHPRITELKQALMPLANLEVHPSRPDEFILVNIGCAITAGDVRKAKRLMSS